jgi:hypothetical protein
LLPLVAFLVLGGVVAAQEPTFDAAIKPFLAAHCIDCHGPDVKKAGLRLDELKPDFSNAKAMKHWIHVHDKLVASEMPPKKRARPPQKDINAVTAWLKKELHAASLARQQKEGRTVIRRLNRTEYENTIRDLLGINIELKEMLPEDNTVAGFDNVSAALDFSATHWLAYQEAAEKAVRSVIPTRPHARIDEKRTGKDIVEHQQLFKPIVGFACRLQDETLVLHYRLYSHIPCGTAPAPQAGRYRVQVSMQALETAGKPLAVAFMARDLYGRNENDIRAVRDVPADKPVVIEMEVELAKREMIVVHPWTLPPMPNAMGRADKKSPGLAVEWMKIEGPLDPWPPAGYQRLFGGVALKPKAVLTAEANKQKPPQLPADGANGYWIYNPLLMHSANPKADAERLIRDFLPRAFRRPVSEELQKAFVKRVHDKLDKNYTFFEAMSHGYQSILSSPHFLLFAEWRAEPHKGPVESTKLDDYALASRLSYFLWSTLPDDELMTAARKGGLSKPEALRAQVERMLKDKKAHRFTENFCGQWLDLRKINATVPDPQLYVEYDPYLFWSMPRETELFFEEILARDRSVLEFVHSNWSMLNERLARHYGVPGFDGGELRKVILPANSHRGGVMTQAAILKVTADGTRTSPVLRGKWVLERIIGKPPAPPPPDIPAIDPDIRGATTIRQQLDKHRNTPACASCHVHIDPPGFALESFDVIGGWRDFYRASRPTGKVAMLPNYPGKQVFRGPDVEKGFTMADGRAFKDIDEYKKLILENKEQLARNLVEKVIIYATGAEIQFADREVVEQIVATLRTRDYGFRTLIHEVVQSRMFLNK